MIAALATLRLNLQICCSCSSMQWLMQAQLIFMDGACSSKHNPRLRFSNLYKLHQVLVLSRLEKNVRMYVEQEIESCWTNIMN